jgi:hypothetical protein
MNSPSHHRRISDFGLRPAFGCRLSAFGFLVLALALQPQALFACAACAGQSDSPMAKGMNWGILSLLAVIGMVLGGVVSFFVYLGKKSAAAAAASAAPPSGEPTNRA